MRFYSSNEVINIKSRKLSVDEALLLAQDLDKQKEHELTHYQDAAGYAKEIHDLICSQLLIKAKYLNAKNSQEILSNGFSAIGDLTEEDINRIKSIATRLTSHFIKRKLDRIKDPKTLKFQEGSELLDPHHHLSSVYLKEHRHLLYLLPDFSKIYVELRSLIRRPKHEHELFSLKDQVTDTQFMGNPARQYQTSGGKRKFNPTLGTVRDFPSHSIHSPKCRYNWITSNAATQSHLAKSEHISTDYCGDEGPVQIDDVAAFVDLSIRQNAGIIRAHMGETILPRVGKENVRIFFDILDDRYKKGLLKNRTIRIGHGTHMGIEEMHRCRNNNFFVEACLSSNKETGVITKRKEYPLAVMMLIGVKVMIGTDGGNSYYTNLKKEYAHAAKVIQHFFNLIESPNAKDSNKVIELPNGDTLKFRDIEHLISDKISGTDNWFPDRDVRYADLKVIRDKCKNIVNVDCLLSNMAEFQTIMFGNAEGAKLESVESDEVAISKSLFEEYNRKIKESGQDTYSLSRLQLTLIQDFAKNHPESINEITDALRNGNLDKLNKTVPALSTIAQYHSETDLLLEQLEQTDESSFARKIKDGFRKSKSASIHDSAQETTNMAKELLDKCLTKSPNTRSARILKKLSITFFAIAIILGGALAATVSVGSAPLTIGLGALSATSLFCASSSFFVSQRNSNRAIQADASKHEMHCATV